MLPLVELLEITPRISEKTKKKVREAAKKLGYRPNYAARSFGTGKTHTIGLITPDLKNPYYVEFLRAAEEDCISRGYHFLTVESALDAKRERMCLESMLERRCDGVIAAITQFDKLTDLLEEFWARKIPIVISGLPNESDENNIDGIYIYHGRGVEQAVDYLVDLGHREIVFVASWAEQFGDYGRFSGIEHSYRKHGLEFDFKKSVYSRFTGDQLQDGIQATRELLKKRPETTAIIGTNDVVSLGVMRVLWENGLRIPEDVSVIGCDNTWISRNLPVAMTTIDQKTGDSARASVKILFERLKHKEWETPIRVRFNTELLIRESTARVRVKEPKISLIER